MSTPKYSTKELFAYYFDEVEEGVFRCTDPKCGAKIKQARGHGFTNLRNHKTSCGPDYEARYIELLKTSKSKGRLSSFGFITNRRSTMVHKKKQQQRAAQVNIKYNKNTV